MWEAFLLQMNDFDQYLETQLRDMLDPVVATPAPRRAGKRATARRPILAIEAPIEFVVEAIPVIEPVAVAAPAAAPQL